jgi:hypothetical protein
MYPVIIEVKIETNCEEILTMLIQEIVPTARQLPGFASGSWLRANGGHGTPCWTSIPNRLPVPRPGTFAQSWTGWSNFDL